MKFYSSWILADKKMKIITTGEWERQWWTVHNCL